MSSLFAEAPRVRVVVSISIAVLLVLGIFAYFFYTDSQIDTSSPVVDTAPVKTSEQRMIGTSVEGRSIEAYTYGTGEHRLIFVGGIHGGYEWNTVVLAYRFIDYFAEHSESIPDTLSITIIPSLNPDGFYARTGLEGRIAQIDSTLLPTVPFGTGRFNAHGVDLNRNFDCKWKPESTWRSKVVSAGTAAFSEPEAAALRDFVLQEKPHAVVFWHSQANAVYASECEEGILPKTLTLMNAYAEASGYDAVESFDAYEITGDAEGWLASIGIPALTVELETHEDVGWERNLSGVKALFATYANTPL